MLEAYTEKHTRISRLRRSFIGLSLPRPWFNYRPVCVAFMVHKVALGQFSPTTSDLPVIINLQTINTNSLIP